MQKNRNETELTQRMFKATMCHSHSTIWIFLLTVERPMKLKINITGITISQYLKQQSNSFQPEQHRTVNFLLDSLFLCLLFAYTRNSLGKLYIRVYFPFPHWVICRQKKNREKFLRCIAFQPAIECCNNSAIILIYWIRWLDDNIWRYHIVIDIV